MSPEDGETSERFARGVPRRPRTFHDFEAIYQDTPPWDIDRAQPAFMALANAGEVRGRCLDVGCGTGEHALMAAGLGLSATGIDVARAAIEKAQSKASERGLTARFVVGDALELPELGDEFDTVLDCGLFHVFEDDDRARFVASLAAVVPTGGRYFMLCFSENQPGDWGPRRVTQNEIRATFDDHGWRVDAIEPARLMLTLWPDGVFGWLSTLTRT